MRRAVLIALTLLAVPALAAPAAMADKPADPGAQGLSHRPVCPPAGQGVARCHSQVVVGPNGKPVHQTPIYWEPAGLRAAYSLPGGAFDAANPGPTIAIVDAYDDPNAEQDLARYRSDYGLGECSSANGCFQKVTQAGTAADDGWSQEISLDLDMASVSCASCRILLVEAKSANFADMTAAVNTAASTPGVVAISNSYGATEFVGETSYASAYDKKGIAVTVSTGDNGYGAQFPATSNTVTAVGGTSLRPGTTAGTYSETAWSGAGSGCSAYFTKPAWQPDTGCARRAVADVSAVADPNTGVRVYDSYGTGTGYMVFGGTSASAPLIAGVYASRDDWTAADYPAEWPYLRNSPANLTDVTSGSNGRCKVTRWCNATGGWDGPTGLGTPHGTGAF
jgi:hypothetical protein